VPDESRAVVAGLVVAGQIERCHLGMNDVDKMKQPVIHMQTTQKLQIKQSLRGRTLAMVLKMEATVPAPLGPRSLFARLRDVSVPLAACMSE
jgi:hypothetical protein